MCQIECDCVPLSEINVCYLDRNTYCDSTIHFNCGITLNHDWQSQSISEKLTNPDNFGPNGTVKCSLNLIAIEEVKTKDDILENNCHMFYVGNFPVDTITGNTDSNKTSLQDKTLEAIYDWSRECSRNLAIVPQREALPWGYTIEDFNVNPNSSTSGLNPVFSIFDGPFGMVESFNQGGSFQGVITEAEVNHVILAVDANNLPTIAFDFESSDVIVGDIGYFSGPSVGSLSVGGDIITNNDKLACNIFALACQLVGESLFENENVFICEGESYTLPNGLEVYTEGSYLDTIVNAFDCDTIFHTKVNFGESVEDFIYEGCIGDGYAVEIGTGYYDEQNPIGTEILTSFIGCDSIIQVNLVFNEPTYYDFQALLCETDSTTSYTINGTTYDKNNPSGLEYLENSLGCDSIVNVELKFELESSYYLLEYDICESSDDVVIVNGNEYGVNNPSGFETLTNSMGCDSLVEVNINTLADTYFYYQIDLCSNSDSTVLINGSNYGIDTPSAIEIITNFNGCDSIIDIKVNSIETSFSLIDTSICENDNFQLTINGNIYDLTNPTGEEVLMNHLGCDSLVNINIQPIKLDTYYFDLEICPDASFEFDGTDYYLNDEFIQISPHESTCDSIILYKLVSYPDLPFDFDTTLLIDNLNTSELNLNLENISSIFWTPTEGLSCQDCLSPIIDKFNTINEYQAEVLDLNLCAYTINVKLDYIPNPFIPNIFNPQGSQDNSYFKIYVPKEFYQYGIEMIEFQIYDRWGNLIQAFDSKTLSEDLVLWDGKFNGEFVAQGVYVYGFKLKYPQGITYSFYGDLTLVN